MKSLINVIIVDDSKVCTTLLNAILESEPSINVLACASDGMEALALTKALKPDLVIMDIFMPKMDGVKATQAIMEQCPTPILIISSSPNNAESDYVFEAIEAGALAFIEKPRGVLTDGFGEVERLIIYSIKALADVHVIRRRIQTDRIPPPAPKVEVKNTLGAKILALGSSLGGPETLRYIISALPATFPMPIIVTQHITKGFLPGMIKWLQRTSKVTLQIVSHYQKLYPGNVYFAADDHHLIIKKNVTPIALLDNRNLVEGFRPAINAMFSSLASSYPNESIGGLLTGMGKDGAEGLLKMKETGCITFAQSKATSIVYGMPGSAVSMNAALYSIDLEKIPEFLTTIKEIRRK